MAFDGFVGRYLVRLSKGAFCSGARVVPPRILLQLGAIFIGELLVSALFRDLNAGNGFRWEIWEKCMFHSTIIYGKRSLE